MLPNWNDVRDIESFLRRNYKTIEVREDVPNQRLVLTLYPKEDAPRLQVGVDRAFFVINGTSAKAMGFGNSNLLPKFCAEVIHHIYIGEKVKAGASAMGRAAAAHTESVFEEVLKGHYERVFKDDIIEEGPYGRRGPVRKHDSTSSVEHDKRGTTCLSDEAAMEQQVRMGQGDYWRRRLFW